MAEVLSHDEAVAVCRELMQEKGITVDDLADQGWGDPALLPDEELQDVADWLTGRRNAQQPPTVARTDVQARMIEEARAAGMKASDSQADPAVKHGFLYEKQVGGGYSVTIENDPNLKRPGMVMLVGRVWRGEAILHTQRELVRESELDGKTKQLAFTLIEQKVRK